MTDEDISQLPAYRWMPSRIPLRDALSTFDPGGSEPDPVMTEMSKRCGESVWYPVEGGHRVLFLYEGEAFDANRFTLQPRAWNHEHCYVCQEHIPAMTLCYVTEPGQPYISLCASCYERHVISKRSDGVLTKKSDGLTNMKRALFLIGGACWFLFALGFAGFLVRYIGQGAGLQFFGPPVSSGSILLGLVHVVGFATAVVLCFSIGAGLCARGIVREKDKKKLNESPENH